MQRPLAEQLRLGLPERQGLYDPAHEKDACGVGFVCDIKGRASHAIIRDAQHMNCRMDHRGGQGYEANTGDGAGILTGLPHDFLRKVVAEELGVLLPAPGAYGAGLVFLPRAEQERLQCKDILAERIAAEGQRLLGWRAVPTDPDGADIGKAARSAMPHIEMLIVAAGNDTRGEPLTGASFERKLYRIRKHATHLIRGDQALVERQIFYVCTLSSMVIVYKGMLTSGQVFTFYKDLTDPRYTSHLAMVHSRFSTNTFPSWDRAQPNRLTSHNGEINTRQGNINWMNAREGALASEYLGRDIDKLFPIVEPDCSDSGSFDNVLELMLMGGVTLQESILRMIPEAWQAHTAMSQEKRDFYEYLSTLMEPWDGPASIIFTDGKVIGAVLDRNGLRPSRYYLTDDDRCIMASEVGTVSVNPARVIEKGRLQPGRVFLIDFEQGRMIPDAEVKEELARRHPFGTWLAEQRIDLRDLPVGEVAGFAPDTLLPRMQAFGYTRETLDFMLEPLVSDLRDPLGSMGNDAALAVLSDRPRLLYDYFKQLFAQVTNPAIDSIREELIMALQCYIGPEGNLLTQEPEHAHRLWVPHPILTNEELAALKQINHRGWVACVIDITFEKGSGAAGLTRALDRICAAASTAIENGAALVVLSDRGISSERVPVSSLLAVGTVHHHLIGANTRTKIGIVLESGEAREVHHLCCLIGYGADAVNPYLAFEALWQARAEGRFDGVGHVNSDEDVVAAYRKGVAKGILKVMGKMGISTLQSYKGAQIFEVVGLAHEVVQRCFAGTASRIAGADFAVLAEEQERRHELGYPTQASVRLPMLLNAGEFHWRRRGERHMWDPLSVSELQMAARTNSEDAYWRFAKYTNEVATREATLRGLLTFQAGMNGGAVPLEEVETEAEIVKRFATGAMSFGSISKESHEALAIAMNRIGGKSNTGEGGEDPERWVPLPNGDTRRSAIKQVASGRFGVTISYLTNADELQIKIVQGAKPGEGGELPGHKVDDIIAAVRHSTPGVGLISPPPHHDIYSIEDMAQLIHDLKNANPAARISVKLGAEVGCGAVAAGVVKAKADHIVIAGHDGGTGASPLTSIKHAGLPWELGLAETHHTLVMNNLRSRVVLQTDGQLKTGRDLAIAALLGAEEFGFATAPLVALGCIMMRKCHLNTCPVGIATQDSELRTKFRGQPEHVVNYFFMLAKELRLIMAELGFRSVSEMVGRADCLDVDLALANWKAKELDLSALLVRAPEPEDFLGRHAIHAQDHGLEHSLDKQLIELSEPALERGERVEISLPVNNTNRVVGGTLSHMIVKRCGEAMLPDGTIHVRLTGSAGQSLGAWLAQGVIIEVEGDANDYVGKGMSGGCIIIYPPASSPFRPEENILVGNVCLYGATAGEAYFRGLAAERFGVRNSGACTVVEGVGDHGLEYMTGGRAVILGPTGRNFAAGMSGGIAYVWDPEHTLAERCNAEAVDLDLLTEADDVAELTRLIRNHATYTGSTVAEDLLVCWAKAQSEFVKVVPRDYKRVLAERQTRATTSEVLAATVG